MRYGDGAALGLLAKKKKKKEKRTLRDKAESGRTRSRGAHDKSHGPGFLEIVSGPGPLNALYVSCNLIPRRSVRCPDRRVIYANSWASGSLCGQTSWVPSHARCHRRPSTPVVDGRRSPGRRQGARTQHCLADSSNK